MKNRLNFMKSELFKMLVFSEMKAKRVGAIDFTLLGTFFFILFSLSLLISSTNHGLMNSLVDTFLSKDKDGTVPLYATLNHGIDRPISKEILSQLKQDTGIDSEVFVKADTSTGWLYGFEDSKDKEWKGKFLFKESKVWKNYVTNSSSNVIVLNKHSFKNHFNYDTYKLEINKDLDKRILFPKDLFKLKTIWLTINILGKDQLIKFDIVWVENIYDATDTDFLLPMDIYVKYKYKTRIKAYDKNNLNFRELIEGINISMYEHEELIQEIKVKNRKMLTLLLSKYDGEHYEEYFTFNKMISKTELDTLVEKHHFPIDYKILGGESFNKFQIINEEIYVYIDQEELSNINIEELNNKLSGLKIIIDKNSSKAIIKTKYKDLLFASDLIAYAKGKNNISETRKLIEEFKYGNDGKTFFTFDTLYNNSLKKLGFLTKVLDELIIPYGIILIFIFLTLIISQIILIVSHRKSQYTIAIAKGLKRNQVFDVLSTQLIIITVIAAIVSFIFMNIMSLIVSYSTKAATEVYIDIVNTPELNILPIYFNDLVLVTFIIITISLSTVYIYMKKINICNKNGYIGQNLKG